MRYLSVSNTFFWFTQVHWYWPSVLLIYLRLPQQTDCPFEHIDFLPTLILKMTWSLGKSSGAVSAVNGMVWRVKKALQFIWKMMTRLHKHDNATLRSTRAKGSLQKYNFHRTGLIRRLVKFSKVENKQKCTCFRGLLSS